MGENCRGKKSDQLSSTQVVANQVVD